jgi:hypothetical protein
MIGLVAIAATLQVAIGGVSLHLPVGWRGHVEMHGSAAWVYASTFRIGSVRGDSFAEGAQARMRQHDLLIVLVEYLPPRPVSARWRRMFPIASLPFRVTHAARIPLEGQRAPSDALRNARVMGRYFSVVVFFGTKTPDRADFARANAALAGISIARR